MTPSKVVAKTVDEYLQALPKDVQAALNGLRQAIKAAAPEAEEVISYQIPTYKYNGPLVHFAAHPDHCSLTVVSETIVKRFSKELKAFKVSGRTIQFRPDTPLPADLVKKIVRTRLDENSALAKAKSGSAKASR